jgi:hypothetical protein
MLINNTLVQEAGTILSNATLMPTTLSAAGSVISAEV